MKSLSKEKIREKHLFENGLSVNKGPVSVKIQKAAYGAMDEWADQQSRIAAIAFAQWLMKNYESACGRPTWYGFKKINGKVEVDGEYTAEELYKLFIQEQ